MVSQPWVLAERRPELPRTYFELGGLTDCIGGGAFQLCRPVTEVGDTPLGHPQRVTGSNYCALRLGDRLPRTIALRRLERFLGLVAGAESVSGLSLRLGTLSLQPFPRGREPVEKLVELGRTQTHALDLGSKLSELRSGITQSLVRTLALPQERKLFGHWRHSYRYEGVTR